MLAAASTCSGVSNTTVLILLASDWLMLSAERGGRFVARQLRGRVDVGVEREEEALQPPAHRSDELSYDLTASRTALLRDPSDTLGAVGRLKQVLRHG